MKSTEKKQWKAMKKQWQALKRCDKAIKSDEKQWQALEKQKKVMQRNEKLWKALKRIGITWYLMISNHIRWYRVRYHKLRKPAQKIKTLTRCWGGAHIRAKTAQRASPSSAQWHRRLATLPWRWCPMRSQGTHNDPVNTATDARQH